MALDAQDAQPAPQRSTISTEPLVKEAVVHTLGPHLTPTEGFYVRNHFPNPPRIDAATWRLAVEGMVETRLSLSFDELRSMPSVTVDVTLECAGNSRSYMAPPAEGIQFRHGAVSSARWRGVPLRLALERAGVKPGVVEAVFYGSDAGEEEEDGAVFATDLPYARSLPLDVANGDGPLLAYEMNGEPLAVDHGFPVRLVTPQWYGMASVKWLRRIELVAEPFQGFFQSRRYVLIGEGPNNSQERIPVARMLVKSLITLPRHGAVLRQGEHILEGFAWSGNGEIATVEVSINGGADWRQAELLASHGPGCWRQWRLPWTVKDAGHFVLMSRATDSTGDTQPLKAPWNYRGYANNSVHSIAVETLAGQS